jgi:hypothetical protein
MGDILVWFKDYGIIGSLIVVVVVGAVKLVCNRFKELSKKIENATGRVTSIHVALSDADGNPVVQHDLLRETLIENHKIKDELRDHDAAAQKHYADVARLADENKVRDCDVSKCLHINLITKELESVILRLNQFEEAAKESRGNTLTSLDSLRSQMTDLTRDILATLRVFKGGSE